MYSSLELGVTITSNESIWTCAFNLVWTTALIKAVMKQGIDLRVKS